MNKSNFLLVDLNDKKTKKLAETITSDTSRKILEYLTEKEDSEANIASNLNLPISTIHYHLQKLLEAKLVLVEEFHYSKKGREINHYKLANKYIIIAPKKVSGLREKLQGIFPVALGVFGISALIKIFTSQLGTFETTQTLKVASSEMVRDAAVPMAQNMIEESAQMLGRGGTQVVQSQPDIAMWFLLGSLVTIILYLFVGLIKEWKKK